MKKLIAILVLGIYASFGFSQIVGLKSKNYDSLSPHTFIGDVGFSGIFTKSQDDRFIDAFLISNVLLNYDFVKSDISTYFHQEYEYTSSGDKKQKSYGIVKYAINKHFLRPDGFLGYNKHYFVLLGSYKSSTMRGLYARWQGGALYHPYRLILPKFKFNVGVGGVYDFSQWNVNETDRILQCSPQQQAKINFVNQNISLKDNLYHINQEFRPMIYADITYTPNAAWTLAFSTTFQQSLKSPYPQIVIDKYPDLGVVHPYWVGFFDVSYEFYKNFSLTFELAVETEKNNMSLYNVDWDYTFAIGIDWRFIW